MKNKLNPWFCRKKEMIKIIEKINKKWKKQNY